jgi:catechol 2,3-dioxygenase-like lactoylglutathione lyase family enzyme
MTNATLSIRLIEHSITPIPLAYNHHVNDEENMMNNKSGIHRLPFLDNGIAQTAIVVEDLDRTVERYWEVFGVGPWHFYTYEKPLVQEMSYYGKPADYAMRIALSYFGPSRIELIEARRGDSVYADFVRQHGYGVQHLGLLVDDMQAAIALAEEAGYAVIQDGSGFGVDGDGHYAYLDTAQDFGVMFELIERPKGRRAPEKVFPAEN